jgi:hypothetical protein
MSGGSMDYLYVRVLGAEFDENTPQRKLFREHLIKVARALKDIEWNDSGDGAGNENASIEACL